MAWIGISFHHSALTETKFSPKTYKGNKNQGNMRNIQVVKEICLITPNVVQRFQHC